MRKPRLNRGLPRATDPIQRVGVQCDARNRHIGFLVYEPRSTVFLVYVSAVHEINRNGHQVVMTHAFTKAQREALRQVIAEISEKLVDHGLRGPKWTKPGYVLLGEHVTDRDYVLLQVADRMRELCPEVALSPRFADMMCMNNCCR